jgi:hypothetical protein
MLSRYVSYITITTVINLFCFYYVIIFCAIYPKTSLGWWVGCLNCLAFKFFAEVIGPFVGATLRHYDKERDRYMWVFIN